MRDEQSISRANSFRIWKTELRPGFFKTIVHINIENFRRTSNWMKLLPHTETELLNCNRAKSKDILCHRNPDKLLIAQMSWPFELQSYRVLHLGVKKRQVEFDSKFLAMNRFQVLNWDLRANTFEMWSRLLLNPFCD